jgi:hypothetical protein
MDPRQLMQRLVQIKQEGEAIVQQLTTSGVPQEAIMAALSGQQPGMGGGRGPDLPPGIPANGSPGVQAANVALSRGGGAPQGLLGGR